MYLGIAIGLVLILIVGVLLIPYFRKIDKAFITAVLLITFILYATNVYEVYKSVGANDWNFLNVIPLGNVSPFTFFICPIYIFLPKKLKPYFATYISLISLGMLLSPIFNCLNNYFRNYAFHYNFLCDYLAHIFISLLGIYFVATEKTHKSVKNIIKSGLFLPILALTIVVVNLIFDTAFFGLSLRGKHNIYGIVLVNNSYLSALIYLFGLICIEIGSYYFSKIVGKLIFKIYQSRAQ